MTSTELTDVMLARRKIVNRVTQALSTLSDALRVVHGVGDAYDEGYEQASLEAVSVQLRVIRERLE